MKNIFLKKKNNNIYIIYNNIKKHLKNDNFHFNKLSKNNRLNLIFPLYSPKIIFFKISGVFFKNRKKNSIFQSVVLQSVVSKNKVVFNISPSIPLLHIF